MVFNGVLGQERACAQLAAELISNRLAHAYLFVGPKGVGRATTAIALFKVLNCQLKTKVGTYSFTEYSPVFSCDTCVNCKRIVQNQHEDLIILNPSDDQFSTQIKAKAIRRVIRVLSFPPFAGKWRLILIREAERMSVASANMLLKILEEPSPRNLLILTVQNPAEIISTITSRCRGIRFTPLPDKIIITELVKRGVDCESAYLKTALSAGSLSRALRFDYLYLRETLERMLKHINRVNSFDKDWDFVEDLILFFKNGDRLDRYRLVESLDLLACYYRDQAVVATGQMQSTMLFLLSVYSVSFRKALNAFQFLCQTQVQILDNVTPELTLVILFNFLRKLAV